MGAETDCFPLPAISGVALKPAALGLPTAGLAACRAAAVGDCHKGTANSPVRAVLFDVEDVLYDGSAWYRWLAQILARAEQRCIEIEFLRLWNEEFLPAVYRGDRTFFMAFAECLAGVGLSTALVDEIVAAARAQRRKDDDTLRALPGARQTLAGLQSAGAAIGILANTERTAVALTEDLARLGLQTPFACILTSLDLQVCLPDEGCYQAAVAALDCEAAEVLFVGHQARDIVGAQAAGLPTIAFNVREPLRGATHVDRLEDILNFVPACVAAHTAEPQMV